MQKPDGTSCYLSTKKQGPDNNKQRLRLAKSTPGLIKTLSPESHPNSKYADLNSPKNMQICVKKEKFDILRASMQDVSDILPAQDRGLTDKRHATPGYSSLPRPGKKKYFPQVSWLEERKMEVNKLHFQLPIREGFN